jgi:tryptophan synthase beta subunit
MSADLHRTAEQICAAHGISRRLFFQALQLRKIGCTELIAEVQAGQLSMNLALQVARFDHESQRLILEAFEDIKPRQRLGFVNLLVAAHTQEVAHG